MDIKNIKKIDKYTVQLPLKTPDSTVPQTLASYTFGMVPVGYKAFRDVSTQIGTGAYKLKSFTPGQQSVHERNPNYWRGDGSAVLRHGDDHRLQRLRPRRSTRSRRPDRRDDRRARPAR